MAGPEVAKPGMGGFGPVSIHRKFFGMAFSASGDSGQMNGSGRLPPPFAESGQRSFRQKVGNGGRFHRVCVEAVEIEADAGEYRGADIPAKFLRLLRGFRRFGDHKGLPHSDPGHSLDQEPIHAGPDAESKQIGLSQMVSNQIEGFGLHPHVSVGDHDHGAGNLRLGR